MFFAPSSDEMTDADYKATYVSLCTMGAGITGVLLVAAFWASIIGWTLDSLWLVLIPSILVSNNAIDLKPEAVNRIGRKRLLVLYLIAGQVFCNFPVMLVSGLFSSSVSDHSVLFGSGIGVMLGFLAMFGIMLKEKIGNLRIGFIRDE